MKLTPALRKNLSRRSCLLAALIFLTLLTVGCGCAGPAQIPATTVPASQTPAAPTLTPAKTVTPSAALTATASPVAPVTSVPTTATPEQGVLWRAGGDGIYAPLGGLDADGEHVYVAESYQGILVFDLAGKSLGTISPGEIGYVVDVKVGPHGTLYMADRAFHQVSMFNHDGDPLGAFGGLGPGDGDFGPDSPKALAIGPDGEVYVLDSNQDAQGGLLTRVQVFSAEGDFQRRWAIEPDADGQAMAMGPDGTVLVVSTEGYVAEFAPDSGMLIQKLGLESLRGVSPQAIDVDGAGNLVMTTQAPAGVVILDPLGQVIQWLGEETVRTDEGWPEGEFLFPFGVAVTADGRHVFVGDTYSSFAYVTAFERE